jgi:hypothetical protein
MLESSAMHVTKQTLGETALLLILTALSLYLAHALVSDLPVVASRLIWLGMIALLLALAAAVHRRHLTRQAFRLQERQLTLRNLDTVIVPKDSGIAVQRFSRHL